MALNMVQRNVRILALAKGHGSLREFVNAYVANGGHRTYDWWRALSSGSRADSVLEAAGILGVKPGQLMSDNAAGLFPQNQNAGERVTLHG